MNKDSPKTDKWYTEHPYFGMLGVINGVASETNNQVGCKPESAVDNDVEN